VSDVQSLRLDAAIAYARLEGVTLVALDEVTQRPLSTEPLRDPADVFDAWSARPLANVGLQLGHGWCAVRAADSDAAVEQSNALRARGLLPGMPHIHGPDGFVWLLRAEEPATDEAPLRAREIAPGVHLLVDDVVLLPPSDDLRGRWRWVFGATLDDLTTRPQQVPAALRAVATTEKKNIDGMVAGGVLRTSLAPRPLSETGADTTGSTDELAIEDWWSGQVIDGLPAIECSVDAQRNAIDALQVLAAMPDVFCQTGRLVTVRQEDSQLIGNVLMPSPPTVVPLCSDQIYSRISSKIYWFKTKTSKNGSVVRLRVLPPSRVDKIIETMPRMEGVRRLERVSEMPTLRPDGTVIEKPGYDEATGTLYLPRTEFPPIPQHPTREAAHRSLQRLMEPFLDFPWVGGSEGPHCAGIVAAMLSVAARMMYHGSTPLFLIDANVQGAGKGRIADVVSEIVCGREPAKLSPTESDEEMRKRITTKMMSAPPLVIIDNIAGALGGPSLESAITTMRWDDRLLGRNANVELPMLSIWLATGNNVSLRPDMVRRVVHCRLETKLADPEQRSDFRHPHLLEWCREHRSDLLVDVLTILRAYVVAGMPDQHLPAWGSFEGWSRVVRGALVWAGAPDPWLTRSSTKALDPATASLRGFLRGLQQMLIIAQRPEISTVQMMELLARDATAQRSSSQYQPKYEELREVLVERFGGNADRLPDARVVGGWLSKNRERPIDMGDGTFCALHGKGQNVTLWRVVQSGSPAQAP